MANRTIKKFKRGWVGGKISLRISSPYGMRFYPVKKKRAFHHGIDIAVPTGTKILAPVSGTATVKNQPTVAGLYVVIHADGYWFKFMHLSKAFGAKGASKSIKEGEVLGYSGNTGRSTGPHLHFEVREGSEGGQSINSKYWISDAMTGTIRQNVISSEVTVIPIVGQQATDEQLETIELNVTDAMIEADESEDVSGETDASLTEWEDIKEEELKEGLAAGIWQITKMVMDGQVANLRIHDAATSVQTGSLISFFNKMCQKPFVEFFGDTYGDQYYFIIRKPPFDREGMLRMMTTQGLFAKNKSTENDKEEITPTTDLSSPYEIQEKDIISETLSFNTSDIYSWYQFFPIYEMGATSELQYMIPAVLFPEYAAIYGSRDLSIRSQYRAFTDPGIRDEVSGNETSQKGDAEVRNSIYDLQYIIESMAYAPFVRQGTIQIPGNRRIKRGMFIRVNRQFYNEIFYVESVNQSYSMTLNGVNRTTTLSLSHGMIEDYMFGKNKDDENKVYSDSQSAQGHEISYFNIINFGEWFEKKKKITMDDWPKVISSWKVNIDVFQFFLRKHQFFTPGFSVSVNVHNENTWGESYFKKKK